MKKSKVNPILNVESNDFTNGHVVRTVTEIKKLFPTKKNKMGHTYVISFKNGMIKVGKSANISLSQNGFWQVDPGLYDIHIGSSSAHIAQQVVIAISNKSGVGQ